MLNRTLIFVMLFAALCATAAVQARIYKTVDENGNVVFTDVPPKDQAEAVELSRGNRYTPPPTPTPNAPASGRTINFDDSGDPDADVDDEILEYDDIAITAPANDATIRENAGNVSIEYRLSPPLDTLHGHRLELLLDGQPHAETADGGFAFENVDRGSHTAVVRVLRPGGEVLAASSPVQFHLLRSSALHPARRPPPPPPPKKNPN